MKSSANTSFKTRFLKVCEKRFPQVIKDTEIFELPEGTIRFRFSTSSQEHADHREQVLIALFGINTLLNSSIREFDVKYQPHDVDDHDFLQ